MVHRTIFRLLAAGLIAAFTAFAVACGGSDPAPDEPVQAEAPQQEKTVVLYQYRFNPNTIQVSPGTRVVFENRDPEVHNISIPALNVDQNIEPNQEWVYTFDTQGEFAIGNRMSDGMKLDLTVE